MANPATWQEEQPLQESGTHPSSLPGFNKGCAGLQEGQLYPRKIKEQSFILARHTTGSDLDRWATVARSNKKALDRSRALAYLGWLMGLEPTTTGITILPLWHLSVLIGVAIIYVNQQLMRFLQGVGVDWNSPVFGKSAYRLPTTRLQAAMPEAPRRVRLTAARVEAFACPPGKSQAFLWDTDAPALAVRATPTGRKTYTFESRLHGKTLRLSIGDVRVWTLEQARNEARRLAVLVDSGTDPREQKRQHEAEQAAQAAALAAQDVTVGQAWAAYIEARRPFWGELHLRDNVGMMAPGGLPKKRGKGMTEPGPLAHFAPLRLVDVTGDTVKAWAGGEARTRPTRARLGLHLFHAFLNWCSEQPEYAALVPDKNPARNRRAREALGKTQAKKDALLREQLPAFFQAVEGLRSPAVRAYLLGLLLTGARPGELLALRWDDVNAQWKGLTLRDKDASKGGNDGTRQIPLTPFFWHLLAGLPRRSEWVFSWDGGEQPISRPHRRLADACAVAGIEELTLHGLRRSFGTLSEWLELPAGVVAQIQGHKPSATAEKHYRVRPLDLLRLHHERLEAWILEQAGVSFDAAQEPGKLRAVA